MAPSITHPISISTERKWMKILVMGSTNFFINFNGKLNYGKENIITVAVNNDYGKNKVPFGNSSDWPNDGGLIRKVALIVSDKPSANYIHAEPTLNVDNSEGKLKIKLRFDATSNHVKFAISITEENQSTKNTVLATTVKPTWQNGEVLVDLALPKVNPWGFDHPNLYRVDVTVLNGKKAVDKISTNIGFREIKMVNGQTFLNGERIKLLGVEWANTVIKMVLKTIRIPDLTAPKIHL